ncbi:MAG: glycosyltransferase [Alphaproteobacteria bacterium]|nr:glycosyltransferase [Alphaproteobacteria bacterium]MDP6517252.1 glycosyltransferase [Alphaproteobacteria bacterium]
MATGAALMTWFAAAGAALWLAVLIAPWQPWRIGETLEPEPDPAPGTGPWPLDDITVLIPARDEAAVIGGTLAALDGQGAGLRVLLIDDQSGDGTAAIARAAGLEKLHVISGMPPPAGWSGKLWALEQGRARVETPLILLLDADIAIAPGMIVALARKRERDGLAMVSLMAALRMDGVWERLLMPAFIHFFKLLYPFRLANRPGRRFAAAAGGCILIDGQALDRIGGFAAIHGALIDDCALAAAIKRAGGRIWIGLSHGVRSRRAYPTLASVWDLVARTAYAQLRRAPLLLALCTLLMMTAFGAPVAALAIVDGLAAALGLLGLATMALAYLPVLRYYRRSPFWALAMPVIGTLFLLMTWTSAIRHWRGKGVRWKGRHYAIGGA